MPDGQSHRHPRSEGVPDDDAPMALALRHCCAQIRLHGFRYGVGRISDTVTPRNEALNIMMVGGRGDP